MGDDDPKGGILASDPGQTGATALRKGSRIVAWRVWSPVVGGFRLRGIGPGGASERVVSEWEIGEEIRRLVRDLAPRSAVVEEMFVSSRGPARAGGGRRGAAALKAAGSAGLIVAALHPVPVHRIKARRDRRTEPLGWRALVLGLPDDLSAAECEERAVLAAARDHNWPTPSPFTRGVSMLTAAELGALAEAAAMTLVPDRLAQPREGVAAPPP